MKLKKRHKRTLIVLSILLAVLGIFKYKLEHEVEMIPDADNNEINVEFNKSYHIKSNHSNVVVYDGSGADSYIIEIKQIE